MRIPDKPPIVRALNHDVHRPLWSVMIPVFNCSNYLGKTLEGVLQSDAGEHCMQIEVVDDSSNDADVASLVREIGKGRVQYFCQPKNVGSLRNFQTCLERSRGKLIHILHGDDLVYPGFYSRMETLFETHSSVGAAFCRFDYLDDQDEILFTQDPEMDHAGIPENWLTRLGERQRIQYVAMVVKRAVYEDVGGFYGVEYGEDWEMWVRIAVKYSMAYTPEVLAGYRRHLSSISGKAFATGRNMECLNWVMARIQQHLPVSDRESVMRSSRDFYSRYAVRVAETLWRNLKDERGAMTQLAAAWRMRPDARLLFGILKLYARIKLNI